MDIFVGTQQQTTSAQHMPVSDLQALISVNPFAHSILFSLFVQFNSGRSQYRFWLIFGSPQMHVTYFPIGTSTYVVHCRKAGTVKQCHS